jgi:hypothetical protein
MTDLIDGILPVEASRESRHEFAIVVLAQFKARSQDHRKQVGEHENRAARELDAIAHDRRLFPRQTVNH